ncbi:MAG TPA: ABC transporter substrate-binding protein [Acetobacteraceae bacterium]|jgi:NitT/TauT family transport system substrate-binding protein|nr:ABC transporter substrate-binding protein [Acetobacteraceae bacterium]
MRSRVLRLAATMLAVASFSLAGMRPAAADAPLQKVTIALAGKALAFIIQYIAIGGGFYKEEGLDPDPVDVASGTRQAAAVMGGSAEITQVGFAHTMHAVGRGGDLVGICTAFDVYPIALVLSNAAINRLGITDSMSLDEKLKRLHGVKIGITSPGSSTDEFMRTIMLVRGLDPSRDVQLEPIGIGAPMVAAMAAGATDGFAFMSPFTDMAVSRGLGQDIADPMTGKVPEYKDVPYQVITTSRATLAEKRPLLLHVVRAMTKAMKFAHEHPEDARKIVRTFFQDTPEAEFNTAYNTYIKALPATPIISQAQVDSTVKMVNLTEKTPITVTYDQVVYPDLAREAAKELLGK